MQLKRATVGRLAREVSGKHIYCFGAGKELLRFFNEFRDFQIENKVKRVVDNCQEKCGLIKINEIDLSVIHTTQMLLEIVPEDIILITAASFIEIVKQLSQYAGLKDTKVYIYSQLWEEHYDQERERVFIPQKLYTKESIVIPKRIHYCWFGRHAIPKQNRIWMESWKKFCPDYEIIEWNENNYDITKNLYVRQAYKQGKWAFVSDYVRVDVIEQFGGVYLDTDVELLKEIDVFLKNEAFCGFEQKRFVNFGLGYGAVAHHEIVKALRDDYEERQFILSGGALNEKTCPQYQTELLTKYGLKRNGQYQVLNKITVYPEMILCGMSPLSFRISKHLDHTYAIHHYAASWHGQAFHNEKEVKRKFFDEMEQHDNSFYASL